MQPVALDSRRAVAVAGSPGAGKTTLLEQLHARTGWPVLSFGDFVRRQAGFDGLSEDRHTLQEHGAKLLALLGPEGFVDAAVRDAGLSCSRLDLLIDGLRHLEVLRALRDPNRFAAVQLVYVEVAESARAARLAGRGVSWTEATQWDQHATELQVGRALRDAADLVVQSGPAAVEEVLSRIDLSPGES